MAGHIRFKGLTTLSSPSIFRAKQSFNSSPNSPSGQPFLSNQKESTFFGKDHKLYH